MKNVGLNPLSPACVYTLNLPRVKGGQSLSIIQAKIFTLLITSRRVRDPLYTKASSFNLLR